jgi:hypothetical protein
MMRVGVAGSKSMASRLIPLSLASVLTLALPAPAISHSWYSPACCSGGDCIAVPVQVAPVPVQGGWMFRQDVAMPPQGVFKGWKIPAGTFVPSERVKHSQDDDFHVCASNYVEGVVFCIYIPPMGA